MLQIKDIYKVYKTGDLIQTALNGVSLNFRKQEFIAIVGASGSGKSTMLNILGGLDRYDTGDLIINGKSTKKYTERDWDTYRNHSIGFVFQSYNLIPHQSILSNVTLALDLSGVPKAEAKKRAKEALERVGLGDQLHKKPTQMSGGQMQRVAIARALVNNPEVLLADEPTGALDSETSVSIMELLKEISKDKLIIMVTHNPELAEKYANRIISVKDGNIISDTNPCSDEEVSLSINNSNKSDKKTSMSFRTALSLSFNNLKTKKGRTILTSFAGSIGIIGIALILSLSSGVKQYINRVQEDTLSSYPITIESQTVDMTSMLESMMSKNESEEVRDENAIYSNNIMSDMMENMATKIAKNDLKSFKSYLDKDGSNINQYANDIQYGYSLDLNIYKDDTSNGIVEVNPISIYDKLGFNNQAQMGMGSSLNIWTELLGNQKLLDSQYEVIAGRWPEKYDEMVLFVDKNNEISDVNLYSIGLLDSSEIEEKIKTMEKGEVLKETKGVISYSFDELLNLKYRLVINTDYYEKTGDIWIDKSENAIFMKKLIEDSTELKIVGIVRPSDNNPASAVAAAVGYTRDLTEHVINSVNKSDIVLEQKSNSNIDVFTGRPFVTDDTSSMDMLSLTDEEKAYLASLSQEELQALMKQQNSNNDSTYEGNLSLLGCVDLDNPSTINIYPKDFEAKEQVENIIKAYNDEKIALGEDEYVVIYNDIVGIMMASVTSIIDIISYVLIAFVGISLIVSSIMISVIVLISVKERVKEIGILKSLGASRKNIGSIFNAETVIIGAASGVTGVIVTILLNIPINYIIKSLTDISEVSKLPMAGAVVLVCISIVLSFIAGLIPAKIASKKDPVEALRSE